MSRYTSIKKSAAKLISAFGMDVTLQRSSTGPSPAPLDYAVKVVMAEFNPSEKDGQFIQFTDRKAILAAQGLAIVPDPEQDQLITSDETLRIVTVTKVSPGGDDVIYELQVRR
jgi:hypothetical protein